jgi:WD40 repeat protein
VCHPLSAPEQNRPHQFLQSSSAVFACHHWERSQFDPGSREELSAGQLPALCGVSVDSEWVQNVPCLQHLPCPYAWSSNRSQSGLVHIWSLQIWRAVTTLDGHGGQSVTWLQLLSQGSQLHSQGRDQRLCLWDLAEGRNAVVDSVHLESVGFCRSSVLAYGQLHWTLAVPGKGTDEV